jgi:hypothetical protein
MDAAYLQEAVGRTLAEAVTQVATVQPSDGIAFLAGFLTAKCDRLDETRRRDEEERNRQLAKEHQEQRERERALAAAFAACASEGTRFGTRLHRHEWASPSTV